MWFHHMGSRNLALNVIPFSCLGCVTLLFQGVAAIRIEDDVRDLYFDPQFWVQHTSFWTVVTSPSLSARTNIYSGCIWHQFAFIILLWSTVHHVIHVISEFQKFQMLFHLIQGYRVSLGDMAGAMILVFASSAGTYRIFFSAHICLGTMDNSLDLWSWIEVDDSWDTSLMSSLPWPSWPKSAPLQREPLPQGPRLILPSQVSVCVHVHVPLRDVRGSLHLSGIQVFRDSRFASRFFILSTSTVLHGCYWYFSRVQPIADPLAECTCESELDDFPTEL